MNIKRKISKIIFGILIFIIVFNFSSPIVLADTEVDLVTEEDAEAQAEGYEDANDRDTQYDEPTGSALGGILDFGAGIFFYPIKMVAYLTGEAILLITDGVAGAGQKVTPEAILFNKLPITNINFFTTKAGQPTVEFVEKLKESVASWYETMRRIAIIASLCILLYIAIRMATSTIASDKAEYKRMLMDWLVGFVLIFVLHYIIIFVISANEAIVDVIAVPITESQTADGGDKLADYIDKTGKQVLSHVDLSKSLGSVIVYLVLIGITLAFLLMYIKRMIVVAFLIIIAPLITITYAIDKVGDNKSQALDSWLKEFVWTVLIQPFHCVIYIVFASVALSSLEVGTFAGSILAAMCMVFIMQAEDIIKKIFGIQADNIGKMSGSFAMAAGGAMLASRFAGKGAGAVAGKASKAVSSVANKVPKTKDGTGVGTGKTGESSTTFGQKAANLVSSPLVQKSLAGFDNFIKNDKYGRAMASTGKVLGSWGKISYNAGMGLVGASFAMPNAKGLTDIAEGAFTGYAAGQALKGAAKWVGKKATVDVVESGRTRNATNNLNESYRQMQEKRGYTNHEMEDKAKSYLNLDLDSKKSQVLQDFERLFAYNLQTMKHQLEKTGQDSSFESVMARINLRDTNTQDNINNNSNTNNNSNNNTTEMA